MILLLILNSATMHHSQTSFMYVTLTCEELFKIWAQSYQKKNSDLRNFHKSQKISNPPFCQKGQKNDLVDVLAQLAY
jgi:hypothetical protein